MPIAFGVYSGAGDLPLDRVPRLQVCKSVEFGPTYPSKTNISRLDLALVADLQVENSQSNPTQHIGL